MSAEIQRCDREIAEILSRPDLATAPVWLVAMGMCDWECEKALIAKEAEA
jgi:hypothetical protein